MKKETPEEIFESEAMSLALMDNETLRAFETYIESVEDTDNRVNMAVYSAFAHLNQSNKVLIDLIAWYQAEKRKSFWSRFKK